MAQCCDRESDRAASAGTCPSCGAQGLQVGRETVGAMAALGVPAPCLARSAYSFCRTPGCPVVYYSTGGVVLRQGDLRVPVSAKDPGLDVPLCYCFGLTRHAIAEEIAATGRWTASAAIAAEIRAGRCACGVKNPSGRCCLGEVRAFEKQALQRQSTQPVAGEKNPSRESSTS